MAALAYDGDYRRIGEGGARVPTGAGGGVPTGVMIGTEAYGRISRDDSAGSPSPPSMRMTGPGRKSFLWPVGAGARTISVDVRYDPNDTPRPTLRVKANPQIGVDADAVGTAASGSGWVTIGPVAVTPDDDGALLVEMEYRYECGGVCNWDNIVVT